MLQLTSVLVKTLSSFSILVTPLFSHCEERDPSLRLGTGLAISERKIPNLKHQIANESQKLKVKNKNENSEGKFFNLCSVILHCHFYCWRFAGICLEIGFWDLGFNQGHGRLLPNVTKQFLLFARF
jgi:hypothetical protein